VGCSASHPSSGVRAAGGVGVDGNGTYTVTYTAGSQQHTNSWTLRVRTFKWEGKTLDIAGDANSGSEPGAFAVGAELSDWGVCIDGKTTWSASGSITIHTVGP
jgi:hypothetical protein